MAAANLAPESTARLASNATAGTAPPLKYELFFVRIRSILPMHRNHRDIIKLRRIIHVMA